jgi:hypothetical protein
MAKRTTVYTYRGKKGKTRKGFKTTVTMGKKFRTRAGRYGCYVYINGRRSHFEESGSLAQTGARYNSKRK